MEGCERVLACSLAALEGFGPLPRAFGSAASALAGTARALCGPGQGVRREGVELTMPTGGGEEGREVKCSDLHGTGVDGDFKTRDQECLRRGEWVKLEKVDGEIRLQGWCAKQRICRKGERKTGGRGKKRRREGTCDASVTIRASGRLRL